VSSQRLADTSGNVGNALAPQRQSRQLSSDLFAFDVDRGHRPQRSQQLGYLKRSTDPVLRLRAEVGASNVCSRQTIFAGDSRGARGGQRAPPSNPRVPRDAPPTVPSSGNGDESGRRARRLATAMTRQSTGSCRQRCRYINHRLSVADELLASSRPQTVGVLYCPDALGPLGCPGQQPGGLRRSAGIRSCAVMSLSASSTTAVGERL
jgi:hypothetical protein